MADEVTQYIRQNKVAHLYLKRIPVHEIAEKLDVSVTTVYNDIDKIKEVWRENSSEAVGDRLAQELARIDLMERHAWNQWYKSMGDSVTSTIEREVEPTVVISEEDDEDSPNGKKKKFTTELQVSSIKSKKVKVVKTAATQYMDIIKWCVEQRCKILGLYAPKEAKVTITDDKDTNVDWAAISRREEIIPPERQALIELEESVRVAKEQGNQ